MKTSNLYRQLKRSTSVLLAAALVISSVPGQAKTGKKNTCKEIQLTSPLSQAGSRVSATLTLKEGASFRIKTRLVPSSAKKTALSYKSSREKIASVSKKGVIKARKKGHTTITVSPGNNKKVKAFIKVTVIKSLKKVKKIRLSQQSLTLSLDSKNNSARLKARITSPKKPSNKKINWISTDKTVVSVNKKGFVTAKGSGSATVIASAGDGQGTKATCRVTVENGTTPSPSPTASINTPGISTGAPAPTSPSKPGQPTLPPSSVPSAAPSSTPAIKETLSISIPDNRTGIKQGESIQLTATDAATGTAKTDVTWSVNTLTGVSISESGLLNVTANAPAAKKINVTATQNNDSSICDTISLTVVENISVLTDNHIQLNTDSKTSPQGLTYRTGDDGSPAYSTVVDPMRGSVTRIDESVGYTNDMIAWMPVDSMYAGKTVHISAYIKYDALDTRSSIGLVLNERWSYKNPAAKWNASPDTWYYITGTFTLPEYTQSRYDGIKNILFLSRFSDLTADEHPVYYLDNLVFSVEKADIEKVTLSTGQSEDTIYQNHTLQCSAEVTGTGKPLQKVLYSIEPAVDHVSISETGLLTVGTAAAGSKINIKAVSVENPEKYDTKTLTVLPQTIDSVTLTAPEAAVEIYQNNNMQLSASVTASGEPDTSVKWSISPDVEGASISDTGLLNVGNVADGTELHITAASVFDPSKSDSITLTVRANTINSVKVKSAGDKTVIAPGASLNLYAEVNATGTPATTVTWSIPVPVEGASISPSGNNATLSVADTVADGTTITIRAVSTFDPGKQGEITITVENTSSGEFDLNKLDCEYWEDFSTTSTEEALTKGGVVSYQATKPDNGLWDNFSYTAFTKAGVHIMDDSLSTIKKWTPSMSCHFGNQDDYLQFAIKNPESIEKAYTLSFMFKFTDIAIDNNSKPASVTYELPLKVVALDESGNETIQKDGIQIPYRCNTTTAAYNKEYYEISSTITVPAGKTVRLRLKLDGALPTCQVPDSHTGAENEPHPVVYTIDNVAISSGSQNTISMKAGETYQLNLDTLSTDTVEYYTNCQLAQYTHSDKETTCTRFDTIPASVDSKGLITASTPGDTALIAVITHEDGSTERKQCLVHVKE